MIRETATKYFFFPGEGPAILREDYRNFLREMFDPSRANLVGWPFGAGGGEAIAGGVCQRVSGDVG